VTTSSSSLTGYQLQREERIRTVVFACDQVLLNEGMDWRDLTQADRTRLCAEAAVDALAKWEVVHGLNVEIDVHTEFKDTTLGPPYSSIWKTEEPGRTTIKVKIRIGDRVFEMEPGEVKQRKATKADYPEGVRDALS